MSPSNRILPCGAILLLLSLGLLACEGASGVRPADPAAVRTAVYQVGGMDCESCVNGIMVALRKHDGIVHADVDLKTGRAEIRFDSSQVSVEEIASVIVGAGFEATLEHVGPGSAAGDPSADAPAPAHSATAGATAAPGG